jgi:hypothetical protein
MDPLNPALPPDAISQPSTDPLAAPSAVPPLPDTGEMILRDKPEPTESRAELVTQLTAAVKAAKGKWSPVFKRMREDQVFALGKQWPGQAASSAVAGASEDERYVANIVQRHVQQRTAVLYAKNPKAVAKRKERIDYTVWDGTNEQLQQAQQAAQQSAMMGMPPDDAFMQIINDHAQTMARRKMVDRVGKTLEIIYQHYVDEQAYSFKSEMKRTVRRVVTCGVGYVKLGYQRVMEKTPDVQRQIADFKMQLAHLQAMAANIADGESSPDSAEAERLRLALAALEASPGVLVREGLTFDFPLATAIIPDARCRSLATFAGSEWVAEEFLLSQAEVEAIYRRDVTGSYNAYTEQMAIGTPMDYALGEMRGAMDSRGARRDVIVWLVYHVRDGLVYTIADGYPDFLEEPAAPKVLLERFFPWFPLLFNELEHEDEIYPLSDVRLMRHQQQEYNRSREGLREHRMANRPMTITANGQLDDEDREKLKNRPANAIVELNALQPGQKVGDVLQGFNGTPIDPNLYEPSPVFQDVLRVVGTQEANLGGTSNATATESSIAEGSRMSGLESNVDDLDDMLTELARAGGQVLLSQLDATTAREIAGEGAAWPELERKALADELWLSVEAGSSGRPNKTQDIANLERLMPFLLQMPGLSQEWLAREVVRRMDDRIDLSSAIQTGAMSSMAVNAMAKPGGGVPGAAGAGGGGMPGGAAPGGEPPMQGGAENQRKPMEGQTQPPQPGRPPMKPQVPNIPS